MLNLYRSLYHYSQDKGIDWRTAKRRGGLIPVYQDGKPVGYIDSNEIIKPLLGS